MRPLQNYSMLLQNFSHTTLPSDQNAANVKLCRKKQIETKGQMPQLS